MAFIDVVEGHRNAEDKPQYQDPPHAHAEGPARKRVEVPHLNAKDSCGNVGCSTALVGESIFFTSLTKSQEAQILLTPLGNSWTPKFLLLRGVGWVGT